MKLRFLLLSLLVATASLATAQTRAPAIRLTKITQNLISSPQFTYTGAEQFQANQRDRWLEVEVQFNALAEFTEDATFKYYILIGGKLLTGEVTHANIMAGRELRSVMYVPPHVLTHLLGNRPLSPNSVQNIAVQVTSGGNAQDEMSLNRAAPQWFTNLPAMTGAVLNKNETPFSALYWDRYEQIKPTAH